MDIWRRIFEFGYQLEICKPVAKTPVGTSHRRSCTAAGWCKLDAMAGRKAGLRRVDAIHQDTPFPVTGRVQRGLVMVGSLVAALDSGSRPNG
jgi:hypothetical protein